MNKHLFKLGIIVNPFAGIGGALALKGSDGEEIREHALAHGAQLQASTKMTKALMGLHSLTHFTEQVCVYTCSDQMGELACRDAQVPYQIIYRANQSPSTADDSELAAQTMLDYGVDLIVFAGGDGTARNICHAIGNKVPVLGVPAGCKIHSGVYTVTPSAAGEVLLKIINGELVSEFDAEVRDIDEQAFRQGKVIAQYFGEMRVPRDLTYIQAVKMGGKEDESLVQDDITAYLVELIEECNNTRFIMGSGSTIDRIMQALGLPNTLLGVDVIQDGQVIAADVTAPQLELLTAPSTTAGVSEQQYDYRLLVTVIGGQGHIFGRGNQQLSPQVLRNLGKERMWVAASKQKLQQLNGRPLNLDTGDEELNQTLAGPFSIITGYQDRVLYPAI